MSVVLVTLLPSCGKDRVKGWVTGTVTIYNPDDLTDRVPIQGIRVLLLDLDFPVDSADYSHNEGAVIDEALTASDGRFLISGIPTGNYAVIPIPDSIMYRFEVVNGNGTEKFSISKDSLNYQADFTASRAADNKKFSTKISIINRLGTGTITVSRPVFLYNLYPTYNDVKIGSAYNSLADEVIIEAPYGVLGYLNVVSNNLMVKAFDRSGYWLFQRWVANNYFNTPEYAHWQIDWQKQTITRIE